MRSLRLAARAEADLARIIDHYAYERELYISARDLVDDIVRYCAELASLPGKAGSLEPRRGAGVRRINYRKHRILIRYTRSEFLVLRVIHAHRNFP